jgi:hypothetical protein
VNLAIEAATRKTAGRFFEVLGGYLRGWVQFQPPARPLIPPPFISEGTRRLLAFDFLLFAEAAAIGFFLDFIVLLAMVWRGFAFAFATDLGAETVDSGPLWRKQEAAAGAREPVVAHANASRAMECLITVREVIMCACSFRS